MRAAVFHEHGGPEVIRIEEVPAPDPGPGEVRIAVRAVALNHLDLWVRRGLPIETSMPHIGGSDIAGVVEQPGAGVTGFAAGDRVVINPALWCGECRECLRGEQSLCERFRILGEHTNGGFADYVVAPADHLHPLPETVTFEAAAALPVSYQTAWRAVVTQAAVRPGEDVLVIGASGGTAIAAVQFALLAGARVFAVTSGDDNVRRLRELGAHQVFDRLETDFSRAVYAVTGKRGVDVVIENVGEATWKGSVRALARGGRLVSYGATAGPLVQTDLRLLFWRQLRIIGTTMANAAEFRQMLEVVFRGDVEPVIHHTMPLAEARAAHELLEEGGQFGKIVLVP